LPRWNKEHAPQLTGREHPNEWREHHAEQGIGTVETLLPEALCDELRELARQCGVPFKAVLLAAHLKVVSVVTGSSDLLVGVTVNGRVEEADSTDVRGMFLNTAPFRIKLPDGTWRDLIRPVFATERELLPHRRYPFGALQRELGGSALVDVNFVHNHFHVLDKAFGDGRMRIVDNKIDSFTTDRVEPTNFALNVGMIRNPYSNQVIFGMDYHTDVLTPDQVLLYRDYYLRAFESMAADPAAQHQWVSLLGTDERALLTQWSGEQQQLPGGTVHELVARAAAERPDAVAVSSGGASLTYAELEQRAATVARRLRALGVGPEACVGVCMTRSLETVVACLAILKAGGVYVPLDTAFPADRISFMLDEVGAKVVLVHEPTASAVPEGPWRLVDVDANPEPETDANDNADELPAVHSDNGCYVIFTSGSTGRPKGTTVTHRNVVRLIEGVRELLPFGPDDVWSVFHSFAFDFSVWELWGPLLHGGRLAVVPFWESRSPEGFYRLLCDEKVTVLNQTPSAFRQLLWAEEAA
ncbi:MAG TPA: AMP-binding protein, partial [Chloroflexota bacterium]